MTGSTRRRLKAGDPAGVGRRYGWVQACGVQDPGRQRRVRRPIIDPIIDPWPTLRSSRCRLPSAHTLPELPDLPPARAGNPLVQPPNVASRTRCHLWRWLRQLARMRGPYTAKVACSALAGPSWINPLNGRDPRSFGAPPAHPRKACPRSAMHQSRPSAWSIA